MKDDLLKIISFYGVLPQLKKFNEEAYELIEAIRNYEYQYDACEVIGCKEYHIEKEKEHIAEEIANVLNMVEQFMCYYDIDIRDVIEIKHQKINRQLERIENEKDNKND